MKAVTKGKAFAGVDGRQYFVALGWYGDFLGATKKNFSGINHAVLITL